MATQKIIVKGTEIIVFTQRDDDYISLTDIARHKNADEPKDIVKNWMRSKSAIEFLGLWERINNKNFKGVEFDSFRNEAGSNSFVLSPQKWIEKTNAIGIISKSGNAGGTFAHKDIAFEFASWISAEFKLYLIKEFQRLKLDENERLTLGWDAKRFLAKANYKVHTDAVREKLIPPQVSKHQASLIYADEANVVQLVCLAGLESLNAEFIRQGLPQPERLQRLNQIAIIQMRSLTENPTLKKLK